MLPERTPGDVCQLIPDLGEEMRMPEAGRRLFHVMAGGHAVTVAAQKPRVHPVDCGGGLIHSTQQGEG